MNESPHTSSYRLQLASFHLGCGLSLHWTRPKAAEAAYRRALPLAELLAADFPELPAGRVLLGNCRENLVSLLLRLDRPEEAERLCRPNVSLAERLAAEFPVDEPIRELLGKTYKIWAQVLRDTSNPAEAGSRIPAHWLPLEKLTGDFPDNPRYRAPTSLSPTRSSRPCWPNFPAGGSTPMRPTSAS